MASLLPLSLGRRHVPSPRPPPRPQQAPLLRQSSDEFRLARAMTTHPHNYLPESTAQDKAIARRTVEINLRASSARPIAALHTPTHHDDGQRPGLGIHLQNSSRITSPRNKHHHRNRLHRHRGHTPSQETPTVAAQITKQRPDQVKKLSPARRAPLRGLGPHRDTAVTPWLLPPRAPRPLLTYRLYDSRYHQQPPYPLPRWTVQLAAMRPERRQAHGRGCLAASLTKNNKTPPPDLSQSD